MALTPDHRRKAGDSAGRQPNRIDPRSLRIVNGQRLRRNTMAAAVAIAHFGPTPLWTSGTEDYRASGGLPPIPRQRRRFVRDVVPFRFEITSFTLKSGRWTSKGAIALFGRESCSAGGSDVAPGCGRRGHVNCRGPGCNARVRFHDGGPGRVHGMAFKNAPILNARDRRRLA